MTNPSNKKRVVTDDDIQVLDAHIAYAKTQADRAAGIVDEFDRATAEFAGVLVNIAETRDEALAAAGITRYTSTALRDADLANRAEDDWAAVYTADSVAYSQKKAGAWVAAGTPPVTPEGAAKSVNFIPALNRGLRQLNTANYNAGKLQDLVLESRDTGKAVRPPLETITFSSPVYLGAGVQIISEGIGAALGFVQGSPITRRDVPKASLIYTGTGYAFRPEQDAQYMAGLLVAGLDFATTSGLGAIDLSHFQHSIVERSSFSIGNPDVLAYALKMDGAVTGNYWNSVQWCNFHGVNSLGSAVLLTGGATDGANGNRILFSRFMKLRRGVTIDHPLTAYTLILNSYFEFTDVHIDANGLFKSAFNNHEPKTPTSGPDQGSAYFIRFGGRSGKIIHNDRVATWPDFVKFDDGVPTGLLTYESGSDEGTGGVTGRRSVPGFTDKVVMFTNATTITRDAKSLGTGAATLIENINSDAAANLTTRVFQRNRVSATTGLNEISLYLNDQTGVLWQRFADGGAAVGLSLIGSGNPNGVLAGYGPASLYRDTASGLFLKRAGFSANTGWGLLGTATLSVTNTGGGPVVFTTAVEYANRIELTAYNGGADWPDFSLPAGKHDGQEVRVQFSQGKITLNAATFTLPNSVNINVAAAGESGVFVWSTGTAKWRLASYSTNRPARAYSGTTNTAGGLVTLTDASAWNADLVEIALYNGGNGWTDASLPAGKFAGQLVLLRAIQDLTLSTTALPQLRANLVMTAKDTALLQWDGSNYYRVDGASTPIATTTLDFPSVAAAGQQELTMTVTGARVNDALALSRPPSLEAGLVVTARVSAANTVTIRCQNITAAAIDPAAASYTVKVAK